MSSGVAILIFLVCLFATLLSSEVLVRGLSVLGSHLNWTDGFLGLLTALGADAPEIASAIAALVVGAPDVGQGVVLGSNLFNLAMLLGLSAVLAGRVRMRRQGLLLDGTVAVLTLLIVALLLLGFLAPALALVLLVVLFIPYVMLVGLRPGHIERFSLPAGLVRLLSQTVSQVHEEDHEEVRGPWLMVWLSPCALLVIVLASIGLVQAALTLAAVWHLSPVLVGGVVLASLTSIPNAYTAVHLARRERGAAVVSATVNSNTLNLVVGLALPAVLFGMGGQSHHVFLELGWLLGMTLIGLVLLLPARGLTRLGGAGIIVLYLLFVAAHLIWPLL
jgi:cation:H+ antiporter